eukprot:3934132-Rhodomonas_salina.9
MLRRSDLDPAFSSSKEWTSSPVRLVHTTTAAVWRSGAMPYGFAAADFQMIPTSSSPSSENASMSTNPSALISHIGVVLAVGFTTTVCFASWPARGCESCASERTKAMRSESSDTASGASWRVVCSKNLAYTVCITSSSLVKASQLRRCLGTSVLMEFSGLAGVAVGLWALGRLLRWHVGQRIDLERAILVVAAAVDEMARINLDSARLQIRVLVRLQPSKACVASRL